MSLFDFNTNSFDDVVDRCQPGRDKLLPKSPAWPKRLLGLTLAGLLGLAWHYGFLHF